MRFAFDDEFITVRVTARMVFHRPTEIEVVCRGEPPGPVPQWAIDTALKHIKECAFERFHQGVRFHKQRFISVFYLNRECFDEPGPTVREVSAGEAAHH
jgi:hypothetical protein